MTPIRLTNTAKADLLEVWLYAAEENTAAADRLIDEVGRRAIVELDPDFPDWTDRIQAKPYLADISGC
ncbi:MAG: type II toxin-antitoxin system RelE/ParE family toxin [Leptolyngbyaceae cyanobacterium SU_3_3]|nr:type II toxin-antitoxin system RelE/ParE family toxin [Leptolyngbyaceae cyanobacterium SU_3_3]NJR50932.1 type II toxin-antitoxin system RelE/ParE family toxin [Leptolyngbyaceae cyanobacterium CSU_1_3]